MEPKSTALSGKQVQAAVLVADDDLADQAIADRLGIGRTTLERWKRLPDFQAAVRAHIDALGAELSRYSIARRDKRVARLQERDDRLHQIVRERGDHAATNDELRDVPGFTSGYMVRTFRIVPQGEEQPALILPEYTVDTGLIAALNATEKQAAIEVGQWTEKRDLTSGGESLTRQYVGIDPADV